MSTWEKLGDWFNRKPVVNAFILASALFLLIFAVSAIATGGNTVMDMFVGEPDMYFSDYFYSVATSTPKPYTEEHIIYPPLVTCIYASLKHFIMPFVDEVPGQDLMFSIRDSEAGMISYMFLVIIGVVAAMLLMERYGKSTEAKVLFLMFLFSYPFIHTVERGNNMLFLLLLCMIFLLTYNSERRALRYVSYVALGFAVGVKIYPIFLTVLYLRERDYRGMLGGLMVVTLLFFVPFLFTDGDPMILLDNIRRHILGEDGQGGISFANTVVNVLSGLSSDVRAMLGYVLMVVMIVLMVIPIIWDGEMRDWEAVTLVICMMMYGPGVAAWEYMTLIVAIPSMYLLRDQKELNPIVLAILLSFVLVLAPFPAVDGITGDIRAFKQFVLVVPMFLLVATCIHRMIRNRSCQKPGTVE